MSVSNARTQGKITDDSALISLGELFKLEERRVEEERQRQRRIRDEEELSRRARLAREREQLEQQKRSAEQERLAREQQECEEAARLAGLMLGLMARAKVEAESMASEAERSAFHARALEIERLRQAHSTRALRLWLACVGGIGVLALMSVVGVYVGAIEPQHDREVALLQAEIGAGQDQAAELQRKLEERRRFESEQAGKMTAVQGERDRYKQHAEELRALLDAPQKTGRGGAATPSPPPPPGEKPRCQFQGDPMCPFIP